MLTYIITGQHTNRFNFVLKITSLKKRRLEIAVLSDVHLGSSACHAEELITYLSSIDPKILILNGDIFDAKKMHNNYFPTSHLKVIKKIFAIASKGTIIHFITSSRDEPFCTIDGIYMGSIKVSNSLTLKLNGKNTLFFHGDIFDFSFRHSHWFLNFGGVGFDVLLRLSKLKTKTLRLFGKKNKPYADTAITQIKKLLKPEKANAFI